MDVFVFIQLNDCEASVCCLCHFPIKSLSCLEYCMSTWPELCVL